MSTAVPHITVCVCTYRRADLLLRLLTELSRQETGGTFTFSAVVADNDPAQSAKATIHGFEAYSRLAVVYVAEPRRSISHARNRSLEPAQGDYVAFIDDDEYPAPGWLFAMHRACTENQVSGVFGPVRPAYDPSTPAWVKRAGFYDRPEHATGFTMDWHECRTGNVLVPRRTFAGLDPVFRSEFGAGASDQDLFRRLIDRGHRFIWCNEAIVYEVVPPGRCKRRFLLRRALLRGGLSLQHPGERLRSVGRSLLAVPLYALALPFLQLAGHHLFMKYCVRLCDHGGRLLSLVGIRPVKVRDME